MEIHEVNPNIRSFDMTVPKPQPAFVRNRVSRLLFILSGSGSCNLDGRRFRLGQDSCVLIPAGTPYTLQYAETPDISCISVIFDLTQEQRNEALSEDAEPCDAPLPKDSRIPSESGSPDRPLCVVAPTLREMLRYMLNIRGRSGGSQISDYLSPMLKVIIIDMLRSDLARDTSSRSVADRMAMFAIRNYASPISWKQLQSLFQYHPVYMNRVFKEKYGESYFSYLNIIRIGEAKRMLSESNISVTAVAAAVGFGSQTHFSTAFRAEVGMTPTEYRERNRNK